MLVYSHDAYGLGNIRRMLAITDHLVTTDPNLSVLLVTGSPMAHGFRISPQVDYVKLPSISRNADGDLLVRSLGLSLRDTLQMRKELISRAVRHFAPDLLLVDKKPYGLANELEPAFAVMRGRFQRPKAVLVLRDILDDPQATIRQWSSGGYHEAIESSYDLVLVAGDPQIFDAGREYRFPASTRRKLCHSGYIGRPCPARSPAQVRADLAVGDKPLVVVTVGGGDDGGPLAIAYLQGLPTLPERGFKTLLVTGPEMSPDTRRAVDALTAHRDDVIVREFCADLTSAMNAADLVVSMGGYNTACELLSLRKWAVVVPRVAPVQEQRIRAERLQARGLLCALLPHQLTPQRLIETVVAELFRDARDRPRRHEPQMDGLPQIGAAMAALPIAPPKGKLHVARSQP
jgi:predicted glycosyltransferase